MANVVVNLFCAKFKNISTPCPGPGRAPLSLSCPWHSLHAHFQPWTMTQTMIFTFFICLRKVFLPFLRQFCYSTPSSSAVILSLHTSFLFCLRKFALKLELELMLRNEGCCARLGIYKNEIKKANSYQSDHGFIALIIERGTMWAGVWGVWGYGRCAEIAKTKM